VHVIILLVNEIFDHVHVMFFLDAEILQLVCASFEVPLLAVVTIYREGLFSAGRNVRAPDCSVV
jgi:hypothetical protein